MRWFMFASLLGLLLSQTSSAQEPPMRQLTFGPENDFEPAWSPDGTQIAFRREVIGERSSHIWVIPANGGTATQLTFGPGYENENGPAWSPDGTQITFSALSDQVDLWVIPSDHPPQNWSIDSWDRLLLGFRPGRWTCARVGSRMNRLSRS
jgi:Tol biopolymer transport system component